MGRAPCCSKVGLHRGPWTVREDTLLTKYIQAHGEGQWRSLPKMAGLLRCGKSCRLRWMNYLRPNIKRGNIQPDEDDLIIRLHKLLGNRWSLIAGRLPGRTDNEIKNYWNTHLSKKIKGQEADHSANEKKKKNNNKSKNQNKRKEIEENVERMRTIVHLPKPIRLTSLSRNFQVNLASTNSDEKPESVPSAIHEGEVTKQNLGVSWPDFREGGILDGAVDEWDPGFAPQFNGPTKDDMLEKLFGEYLDLLGEEDGVNLDSFSEFS